MTRIVIVTHGEFGAYLLEAAEGIIGRQHECLDVVTISSRAPVEDIKRRLEDARKEFCEGDGVIFLTDIVCGTPTNVVLPLASGMPDSAVLSGVNLNMVLSAFSYRGKLPFEKLVAKVIEDGRKSICNVKELIAGMKSPGLPPECR